MASRDDVQFWLELGGAVIVWAFTAGVIWNRLNNKIDRNKDTAEQKAREAEEHAKQEAARVEAEAEADRQAIRADAELAHQELLGQINGLGGRLKTSEESCSRLGGRMESAERQLGIVQQQGADAQSRLGRVEARLEAVDSHMTEFKLELFQHIADTKALIVNENAATRQMLNDRDANLRERVARIEQGQGIPHKDR
jgi:ABC-type nickel/cobalt efflux system permease component RcnA